MADDNNQKPVFDLSGIDFGTNFAAPDLEKVEGEEPTTQMQDMFQYDLDTKITLDEQEYNPPELFSEPVTLASHNEETSLMGSSGRDSNILSGQEIKLISNNDKQQHPFAQSQKQEPGDKPAFNLTREEPEEQNVDGRTAKKTWI
jgi:hypothetical protein